MKLLAGPEPRSTEEIIKEPALFQPTHAVTTQNILFCQAKNTNHIVEVIEYSAEYCAHIFLEKLKKHLTQSWEFHLLLEAHLYSHTVSCAGKNPTASPLLIFRAEETYCMMKNVIKRIWLMPAI